MSSTAKIIRHRHKYHHYMNDDLKEIKEETYFKIVFSAPVEFEKFRKWCVENDGVYDYDKENSCQRGSLPKIEAFKDEICWCDIMTFYLLHIAGYEYHSSISPYKGEVYVKSGPL
ncbi:MAG TPA: hypothetical protein VM012_00745 [Flavitalea sp.]|nr:hypothetical protein [Flavitalea sp.]